MLKKGSKGQRVKLVQQILRNLGYNIAVDGVFGPETEKAVRLFQAASGLEVDGIVGPKTYAALIKKSLSLSKPAKKLPSLVIEQDFIPMNRRNRPMKKLNLKFITIHDTANPGKGADARAHAKYLKSRSAEERRVSVHAFVDDKRVVQTLPWDEVAYHTGTNEGNLTSIGIEICENVDGNRAIAEENAARLVAMLLKKFNLPLSAVRTHQSWMQYGNKGKFCPHVILSRPNGWKEFVEKVKNYYLKGEF